MLETPFDGKVPEHLVSLFARTGEIVIDDVNDHAPDKAIDFLYDGPDLHGHLMALNSKSPISCRKGETLELFDKSMISLMSGSA